MMPANDASDVVPKPLLPWWKNPGLWLAIATPIAGVLNQRYGIHLSGEELAIVMPSALAGIIGLFGQHVQHNSAAMNAQSRAQTAAVKNGVSG